MNTFKESGLKNEILTAIDELGFVTPTKIQKKAIEHLMHSGQDLIATAQTGTGKTAAFGLPILHHIDENSFKVQALILCPTRELCMQITKDMESYSKNMKDIRAVPVYGGASIDVQQKEIKRGCQIVVGTPGRTLDMIRRNRLNLSNIRWVVLDESDEMLSMGFKEELDAILAAMPKEKQTLLFSATMPNEILGLAKKYMVDPIEIAAGNKNISTENVSHEVYSVESRNRYAALKRIADVNPGIYGIIFCRTRSETQEVADSLMRDGYNADALHGDLSQQQRDYVMGRFRKKQLQLLVATDVAARGLDVNDLTHVINYNLPEDPDIYVHRSGRTGRADKKGISITIVAPSEMRKIRFIEKKIGKKIEIKQVPSGKEICKIQLFNLIGKVETVDVNENEIKDYLTSIYEKLEWLDRDDLIKRFVSVEFNRFLSYYQDSIDINVKESREGSGREGGRDRRSEFNTDAEMAKFSLNIGRKQGVEPKMFLQLVRQYVPIRNIAIGKINIQGSFTIFEAEEAYKVEIMKGFKKGSYQGMKLKADEYLPWEGASLKEDRGRRDRDRNRGGRDRRKSSGGGGSSSTSSGGGDKRSRDRNRSKK